MDEIAVPELVGELDVRIGQLGQFTEVWLTNRRLAENTRAAYRVDLRDWLLWCRRNEVDPITAKFTAVNAWARDLEHPAVGKGLAPTTVARKMSAVSSWYAYLVKLGAVVGNPAAVADRPRIDRDFTSTTAFDGDDADRMSEAAAAEEHKRLGPAGPVLAEWLVDLGTRATETCELNIGDLGHTPGYRIVRILAKGGKRVQRTIPPDLAEHLDTYLEGRFPGGVREEHKDLPLFADVHGSRIDRFVVSRYVRRLAKKAGVAGAERISAHSARHAFATMARQAGAGLEDRQAAMGHADPRTTQRYDHTARMAENDPALLVAGRRRKAQKGQDAVNTSTTGSPPAGGVGEPAAE